MEMKVKAYLKPAPHKPITLTEVEMNPKPSDLVVKTTHVGLARGDVFILDNAWNDTVYPAIGTAETLGIVEETGRNTKGFKKGDRVGFGYIVGACMNCEYCKRGLHQYCSKQINTELGGWGGFAEKLCIDYRLAVHIPKNVASETSAPLLGYGVTAYSGIVKAHLPKGSTVGVIGLGGLGYIAVKILNAMGMNVTVFSHSPQKAELAMQLGATDFIRTTEKHWSESAYHDFDLIINASYADLELPLYLPLLEREGKFCYLGLPFHRQEFDATMLADYGSRSIYGSYVGSISEMEALLQLASEKNLKADIVSFPIADYEKAIALVKSGKSYKRVVLYW